MYSSLVFFVFELFFLRVTSSEILSDANKIAAEADMNAIIEFIFDFEQNQSKYKTFMSRNSIKFPQEFINYYANIETLGQSEFMTQLSTNFPFTEFKSFATEFPWFSEFLFSASITEFYLPDQLTTSNEMIISIENAFEKGLTETTIIEGSATNNIVSTVSSLSADPLKEAQTSYISSYSIENASFAGAATIEVYSIFLLPNIFIWFLI